MPQMKRNAKITSRDSEGQTIEINVLVKSNDLDASEIDRVATQASREIADAIRKLVYTDFGPENTQIKMG